MKLKFSNFRKFFEKGLIVLLLVLSMLVLVGNNNVSASSTSKYKLLLEDVTSKYSMDTISQLNEKIVSEVPDEVEEFWVIVKLKYQSLTKHYSGGVDTSTYKSVAEFANSYSGKEYLSNIDTNINKTINELKRSVDFIEIGSTYNTALTGFACKVDISNYLELAASDLVSDLIVCEEYDLPQVSYTSTSTSSAVKSTYTYQTGIYDTSNVGYDGSGMVVAILDTGLDIHHSTMQVMPTVEKLSLSNIESVLSNLQSYELSGDTLQAKDLYVNSKVAYAYDYADHDNNVYPGTSDHGIHVAGIIAGNDDVVTGSAPGVQLAIMKVFSDSSSGATSDAIISALEDAVLLDVDVINMSLGSACGFTSEDGENSDKINEVYQSVEDTGINLVVAAANNYSSGYGGETTNSSFVTNPDLGTVSSPSTYHAAISVASMDTELSNYMLANGSTPVFFREASDSRDFYDFIDMLLLSEQTRTLEYVTIDGTGVKEDYRDIDVKGKIALVKRGTITFERKQQVAAENGAIACIIYNNTSGGITMSIEDLKVPTCSISQISGNLLAEEPSGTITLSREYQGGPFMSDFSSWGPSPDLQLFPEITAPGGTILSGYRNGYAEASGTSMASPNLAGVVAIVKQYVREKFSTLSKVEQADVINQMLMSTAEIITDENNNPYSPRKQGAGLANVSSVLKTDAYITVEGSDKTKISLGDDPERTGVYQFSFNVNNINNSQLVYTINPYVMTESLVPGASTDTSTIAEQAYMLDDSIINISVDNGQLRNGNQLVLAASTTATVNITITLSDDAKLYLDTSFRYGMYIEGFVELISNTSNGINLSIPYLGYYGDWTEAPIFDTDIYSNYANETTSAYYETTPLGLYYNGQYLLPLGKYSYRQDEDDEVVSVTTDKASISYLSSSIYALYSVYAGMFRNAKQINYEITDTLTGEVISSAEVYNGRKAFYSSGVRPHGDMFGISPYGSNLPNNRNYTFTMTALLDYRDGGINTNAKNSFSFSFYVDYEAPVLIEDECEFYIEKDANGNDHYYVDLAVYDNHYLMAYAPCYVEGTTAHMLTEQFIPNYSDIRNGTTYTTLEITDYMDNLNDDTLALYVQDYALNSGIFTLQIPEDIALTYIESLELEDETISLKKNETVSLGLVTTPSNAWLGSLEFNFTDADGNDASSSFVTNNGSVKAYQSGNYSLHITDNRNEGVDITVPVIVSTDEAENNSTVKDFEFKTITYNEVVYDYKKAFEVHPNETVVLGIELNPWDANQPTITWRSSDEEVATIDENGVITFHDVYEETRVRITATVDGINHSTSFVVSSAFYVESGYLRAYYGSEVDLVIPNNLNIFYLYPGCFQGNTTLKSVVLPDKLITINSQAFQGCTALESVTIPKDVSEFYIGANAFYGCTALTSINLEDATTGIFIGANAFYGCTSLADIDLSMVVNLGANAFYGCTALRSVDLTAIRVCGENAFYNCRGLVNITFGEHTALSTGMFSNCTGLLTVRIPFANVPERMFYGCTSLTTVNFINDVDEIGAQAFQGCSELTTVNFRGKLRSIGQQAFYNCTGFTSFKFPAGLESISSFAFRGCSNLINISVANDAILNDVLLSAFLECSSLEQFIVTTGSKTFVTDDYGILYRLAANGVDKDAVVLVPTASNLTGYALPSTVTVIESGAFSGRRDITSLDLSNVTKIGAYAFHNTDSLESVTLSNKLLEIGEGAFYNSGLVTCNIPASVKEFGAYAFAYCEAVISFEENSSITTLGEYALSGIRNETLELPSNLESIGFRAFYNCPNLTSITLPESCNEVADQAFELCRGLKEVTFTAVTSAGSYIFLNSSGITKFTALEGTTALGQYMFAPTFTYDDWGEMIVVQASLHTALVEVNLPSTVTSIPLYCFGYCDGLTKVESTTITEVGPYAFTHCENLETVSLENLEMLGVEEFDTFTEFSYAFSYCSNLKTVVLPDVTKIYEAAFFECGALTTVDAPKLLVAGDAAFYNCRALQNTNFTDLETIGEFSFYVNTMLTEVNYANVTSIGISAFYSCNNLTTVTLPKVEVISDGAFAGCRELKTITLGALKELGNQAFLSTNLSEFTLGATVTKVGFGVFTGNYNLKEINVSEENEIYFAIDGVLYETLPSGKVQLIAYPSGKEDSRYVVYEQTARISKYAFAYNTNLESVVLPYSLETIAARAFYRCNHLTAYEFTSYHAPVLESEVLGSTIHTLNYDSFFDLITTFDGIYMSSPSNGVGYDSYVYQTYFDHNFKSNVVATDATYQVIQAIEAIGEFDEFSNRVNGLIVYARNLYDRIADPLQKCLVTNYEVLVQAEEKIASLRNGNISTSVSETNQSVEVELNQGTSTIDNSTNYEVMISKMVAIVKESKNEKNI